MSDEDWIERLSARAIKVRAAQEERARMSGLIPGEPPLDADVDHVAGCPGVRPARHYLGERPGGEAVWRLRCSSCRAEAIYVDGRRPDEALRRPGPHPPWPPEAVLARRDARRTAGLTYGDKAVAEALSAEGPSITETTVRRYRRAAERGA